MSWIQSSTNYFETHIAAKMILVVAVVVVLLAGISFGIIYNLGKESQENSIRQSVKSLAVAHSNEIGMWLENRKADIANLAGSPFVKTAPTEDVFNYLKEEAVRLKSYESIWITDAKGDYRVTAGNGGNIADRDFFQLAKRGNTVVSGPVKSQASGKWILIVASPVYLNGQFSGVVGGVVNLSVLSDRVSAIQDGKSGTAFLVQKDGQLIAHSVKSQIMTKNLLQDAGASSNLKQAITSMTRGESGIARYELDGVDQYAGYATIPGMDWGLAVTVPASEASDAIAQMGKLMLGLLILFILIVPGLMLLLTHRIITLPILQIREQLTNMCQGNLADRSWVASRDEMGQMAQHFNEFADIVQNMVQDISRETAAVQTAERNLQFIAATMAANSEEVSSQIIETSGTTKQVSAQIQLVAESSRDTSKNISAVVDAIGSISKAINDMVGSSGNMTESVKSALTSAEETDVAMQSIAAAVTEINSSLFSVNEKCDRSANIAQNTENESRESVKAIKVLSEQSRSIGQIVNLINSIAEKTDMLALNAAIEAVRAGQAGKGFAVVASEVKELAHQTASATREIGAQIAAMQENITHAVETVTGVMTVIQETTAITGAIRESVGSQVSTMGNIYYAAEQAAVEANGVRAAMDKLSGHATNIAQSIQLLAAAADAVNKNAAQAAGRVEEVARSADEVSVAVSHMAETTQDISAASSESAKMAGETSESVYLLMEVSAQLKTIVEKFRTV